MNIDVEYHQCTRCETFKSDAHYYQKLSHNKAGYIRDKICKACRCKAMRDARKLGKMKCCKCDRVLPTNSFDEPVAICRNCGTNNGLKKDRPLANPIAKQFCALRPPN